MPLTTAGRNNAADGITGGVTHVSALTDLGVTEAAGGSYARQAVSWNASASGVADNSGALSIPIPAGTTVVAVGGESASSAGTRKLWAGVGTSLKKGVASVDTIANDTFQSDGHGLANTNRVFVHAVQGEALPTGLSATTLYFVVGAATDTFQLSTTSGGSAVDVSSLNEFAWGQTIPETFASAGTLTVAAGALDVDMNAL